MARRRGRSLEDNGLSRERADAVRVVGTDMFLFSFSHLDGEGGLPLVSSPKNLLSGGHRPRLSHFWECDEGDRRPKSTLGDHCNLSGLGEIDRAFRFRVMAMGAVFARVRLGGIGGGARGVRNLSPGTMVLMSSLVMELMEALRSRGGRTSTGTQRRLTGCPGR
jgi:hypothetical protein